MSIQILQYEFMGPIPIDQWGPPMEKVVYVLFSRNKEKENFVPIYVDQCTKSDDVGFFTKNPKFKCWINNARSEKNLYVAIYPMFDSPPQSRLYIVDKIISKYKPACNMEASSASAAPEKSLGNDDSVATDANHTTTTNIKCACCGNVMHLERELEKSNLYKCTNCKISDTRLK